MGLNDESDLTQHAPLSALDVSQLVEAAQSLSDVRAIRILANNVWYRECIRRHALNRLQRYEPNRLPLFWLHLVNLVDRHHPYLHDLSIEQVESLVREHSGDTHDVPWGILPAAWRSRFGAWKPIGRMRSHAFDRQAWNEFMDDWKIEFEAMERGDETLRDLRPRQW